MIVEPGSREAECACCKRPTTLASARAFDGGENAHGERVYSIACRRCVDEKHDRPLREFLSASVSDVRKRATLLVGLAALNEPSTHNNHR